MTSEHWFDRVSVRLTRRQALKAAAVTGAALTVPFARPPVSRADVDFDPCYQGCVWTARKRFKAAQGACNNAGYSFERLFLLSPIGAFFTSKRATAHCLDDALLHGKADFYDCGRTDCDGFDPKQKGGPCDGCPENCCVCDTSTNGYICCFYTCDDTEHSCCGS
jgi:hypothetical protein